MNAGLIIGLTFFTLIAWFAFTGLAVFFKQCLEAPNWLIVAGLMISVAIAITCGIFAVNSI